jgi:hypothetical protein
VPFGPVTAARCRQQSRLRLASPKNRSELDGIAPTWSVSGEELHPPSQRLSALIRVATAHLSASSRGRSVKRFEAERE